MKIDEVNREDLKQLIKEVMNEILAEPIHDTRPRWSPVYSKPEVDDEKFVTLTMMGAALESTSPTSFCFLSTEKIASMAQSSTLNAVKELHSKGISTYGMRDGILYETKPICDITPPSPSNDRSPIAEATPSKLE